MRHKTLRLVFVVLVSLVCQAALGQSYTAIYYIDGQLNVSGWDEETQEKYRNGHLESEVIIRYQNGRGIVETHRPPRADSLKHLWMKTQPIYFDGNTQVKVYQDDISDKEFAIESTLTDFDWEFTAAKKRIGNYECNSAWSFDSIKQNARTVYYTTELPIAISPDGYSTLPGIILEMERITPRGKYIVTLKELREEVDDPSLISADRIPGERVSEEKFNALKAKRKR